MLQYPSMWQSFKAKSLGSQTAKDSQLMQPQPYIDVHYHAIMKGEVPYSA